MNGLVKAVLAKGLVSLKLNYRDLSSLQQIDSVIVVGSSFTGKTTLVTAIRQATKRDTNLANCISVPKRVITRPRRENDDLDENHFVNFEEFNQMIKNGKIYFHWSRKMEGTRTEQYGFLPPKNGAIPVYSANNAVINNKGSVKPTQLLTNLLIIAVYAPENVRAERLIKRSPDLIKEKIEEVKYRLSDKSKNILPYAHIVVRNYGKNMSRTKKDMIELMKIVMKVVKNVN